MNKTKIVLRIICCVFALVIAFSQVDLPVAEKVDAAKSVSELKNEYNKLEEKAADLQNKVNASKNKINKTEEDIENIKESIETTKDQIDLLNSQIINLDKEIETLETQITEIETEIQENYEQFKLRIRAIYMAGEVSDLDVLLGSQNMEEYLTLRELMRSVANHDKALLESIEDSLTEVQKKSKEVEQKKTDAADYKAAAEKKHTLLQSQFKENQELIEELEETMEADKEALEAANRAKEKQEAEIEAAIRRAEAAASGGGNSSSSFQGVSEKGFIWPVAGSSYVSSGWGYRAAFGKFHYGLDITGGNIYGRNVLAAKSGKVIVSGWSNIGYGNYVVIQHSDGQSTVYGHCASLTCSVGDVVSQGDVIAKVGSTGWSTGPHLHFEIRVNGEKVNPAAYF